MIYGEVFFPKLYSKKLTEKKYVFNNMIRTDGVSVSLLMIHKDHVGRKNLKCKRWKDKNKPEFPFIEDVGPEKLERAKETILVGCDPGKKNILQFVDDRRNKLSYSCVQRRVETRAKKNKMIRDKLLEKDESECGLRYYMDIMSSYNSKTCDYEAFKKYVINKLYCNKELMKEYKKEIYRKLRWSKYTHTQRSEAKLIKNIKKTFTDKDNPEKEIVILYGGWSQSTHMKNFMPTPGIGIKRVIGRYFPIFTIDEYNTSKLSFCCEEETENFMYRENPRNGRVELIHGLLSCKNCSKKWQRDVNGALSILYIGKYYIYERERPEKYKRGQHHEHN